MKRQFSIYLIVSLLSLCLIVTQANAGAGKSSTGILTKQLEELAPCQPAEVGPAYGYTGNSAGAYLPEAEINMPIWDPSGISLPNEAGTASPWNIIGVCPPSGLGTAPQSNINHLQVNAGSNSGEQMVAPGQPSRGLIRKADPVPNKHGQTGTLDGFWNSLNRMLGQ